MSRDPDDELLVSLKNIHLDYIFETLKINHVNFGGVATGDLVIADVYSGHPRLSTAPRLHVDNLFYNGAPMGDAEIESHFDSENTGVVLGCDLAQSNGEHTYINGEIFAASDSLYLEFDANKANVEFMKPLLLHRLGTHQARTHKVQRYHHHRPRQEHCPPQRLSQAQCLP